MVARAEILAAARRSPLFCNDERVVGMVVDTDSGHGQQLLDIYDDAVPVVYAYLDRRCRNRTAAEDLTTEVFLGAVESIRRHAVTEVTIAWLIGIARHRMVDHWRRLERDSRNLTAVAEVAPTEAAEQWDAHLDSMVARDVLDELGAHHRAALTLRYIDDLPVAEVAEVLGRTVHATEALLVRARLAFRARYEEVTV
jgi:RNA polymerase sigma-70 factor (ECF subfamily)